MRTLPWSWYADPDVARRERERIFRRAWQYVGHADELERAGSYAAATAGDVPVVLTRDGGGVLRAFLNVCRHRGSVLVEGSGRRATLQCRYHAWTYGLDGALVAAPRAEREDALDLGQLGLVPARVETWGPFVFVNLDPEAPPLADALRPLPDLLAAGGVDVGALRFRLRAEYELRANWKIACENFLECYHCPVAHPGFSSVVDVRPEAYRLAADGLVLSQYGPLRDGGTELGADGGARSGQFHFLWPNLKLNVYPGRPNLSIGPVLPDGSERSRGFLDYFFEGDAPDRWVEELLALDDQVGREDRALVEAVQRGVRTGLVSEGRLLPESERLVARFQRLVADALA